MNKDKPVITDIFTGKSFNVWEDGEFVFLNLYFNGATLFFPKEEWESMKSDFDTLINGTKNRNPAG